MVAARVTRAEQAAVGEAEAHRLPHAVEPGHEDVSGAGERWLDPFVRMEDRAPSETSQAAAKHPPRAGS